MAALRFALHIYSLWLAGARCSTEGVLRDAEDGGLQMLQHSAQSDFFDFGRILADDPAGSFLSRMEVLVKAINFVYNTTTPLFDAKLDALPGFTAGGRLWRRLRQYDRDPKPGGVFARAWEEPQSRSLVVAFKGICLTSAEQCTIDWCFLNQAQSYGQLTGLMAQEAGASAEVCQKYAKVLDFTKQADSLVRDIQRAMPRHRITLTGHSVGGLLSMVTAVRQPTVLKALTFAPTPFHRILQQDLDMSEQQISQLNSEDLVATCDAYDCGINSIYASEARKGGKTCLYLTEEEPFPCSVMDRPYGSPLWRQKLKIEPGVVPELLCKEKAHEWNRYSKLILERTVDGKPKHLPVCSQDYSVLESLQLGLG